MGLKHVRRAAAALLAVCACAEAKAAPHRAARPDKAAPSAASPVAAPDPRLVRGALPNGLRYAILPNQTPRQEVSIRFYVRAGSGLEADAERGVAHFVEHLAFQGSTHFPGDSADARFAEAGISIGRDQNAFTDLNGVDYVLDLQQVDAAKLDLAFTWLRDVADGLTFDPAAAEREKKVVLSEVATRRTGASELAEATARFMAPRLLATSRTPGGRVETVSVQDGASLKAFHDRWYRPDRTLIVVVGDLPVEDAKARIGKAFGDWAASDHAPTPPDPGTVDPDRGVAILAVYTPNFAQGLLQVCRVAPRAPPLAPGVEAWLRDGIDSIWLQALNARLRRLARSADAPLLSPSASRTNAYRQATYTCLSAAPKGDRWREALATLDDEARRLQAHGLTAAEWERARADIDAAIAAAEAGAGTRSSQALAQTLLGDELEQLPLSSPAELARTYALARPRMTAAAAAEAFRARWKGGGPVVALTSTTPVTTDLLRAAWTAAETRPPPTAEPEEPRPVWPYVVFGPSGHVVERREINNPDFTRLRFNNGVRVNFKRTPYVRDRVDIRVAFGGGQQEIPADRLGAALIGVATLGDGGFGRIDGDAVARALQGRQWGLSLGLERARFTLSGATRPADLTTELQVLAAALTDPGFRPEAQLRAPTLATAYYKSLTVEPLSAAQHALGERLPKPHVFDPPPLAQFAATTAADMAAALKGPMTTAPLEATVVGDISEADAVAALAVTLGALAPRAEGPHTRADAAFQRYPDAILPTIRATHSGLANKAAVYVAWPLFVWTPQRQREARQLTLLREVFADSLRRELRAALGLTYTPSVGLGLDRGGDQGVLAVSVDTAPDKVDAVSAAILAIAARLAAPGGVTGEALERVRRPLLDDTARRMETNSWWLTTLDGSWSDPYKLAQQRSWLSDYTTIPASEVGRAAATWLSRPPLVTTATPSPRPAGPPTAPAPAPQPAPLAPAPPTPSPTGPPGPARP